MTNPLKILDSWNILKPKLMTTFQELKANHKDNWALVKPTAINWTQVLNDAEIKRNITERENLIKTLNKRPPNQLLSPADQTKLDQAKREIELLKKRHNTTIVPLSNDDYFHQLRMVNEKHDRLNDKLNWLRTLVRAGDIKQLQELVRKAKI